MTDVRAVRRLLLTVVCVVVIAGCQAEANVAVVVHDDGSGVVTVTVQFDPDAATRVPEIASGLRTADLTAAGWSVTGPGRTNAGVTYAATKGFRTTAELAAVLTELTGPDGFLRDISLTRTRSFAKTTWTFSANADTSKGVAALSDSPLAGLLGGAPLGRDQAALEAELGAPLNSLVNTTFTVTLPDRIASTTGQNTRTNATWTLPLGAPTVLALTATSNTAATQPWVWAAVAVSAAFVLIVVVGITAIRRRRPILRSVETD